MKLRTIATTDRYVYPSIIVNGENLVYVDTTGIFPGRFSQYMVQPIFTSLPTTTHYPPPKRKNVEDNTNYFIGPEHIESRHDPIRS